MIVKRAELRAADRQPAQPGTDHRQVRKIGDADARGPEAVLVPGEQVAGEVQSQRCQAHQQDGPEEELARRAIGAAEDHLHEVNAHQHQRRLAHVEVDRAQQPAADHLILQIIDAFPGTLRPGTVIHPEDQPGDGLHDKAKAIVVGQTNLQAGPPAMGR